MPHLVEPGSVTTSPTAGPFSMRIAFSNVIRKVSRNDLFPCRAHYLIVLCPCSCRPGGRFVIFALYDLSQSLSSGGAGGRGDSAAAASAQSAQAPHGGVLLAPVPEGAA